MDLYDEHVAFVYENVRKSFTLILWNYCTSEMKLSLRELPNFRIEVFNDQIHLLKNVEILMHLLRRVIYPTMMLEETISDLLNLSQMEGGNGRVLSRAL